MMIGKDNQRYVAKRDDDDEEDEDFAYENEIEIYGAVWYEVKNEKMFVGVANSYNRGRIL